MLRYLYCECPDCGFSIIVIDAEPEQYCGLCAGDSGHVVRMTVREAEPEDRPEGHDERKELP